MIDSKIETLNLSDLIEFYSIHNKCWAISISTDESSSFSFLRLRIKLSDLIGKELANDVNASVLCGECAITKDKTLARQVYSAIEQDTDYRDTMSFLSGPNGIVASSIQEKEKS
jgi:hypothetical protein